ncbi:MAG TPA: SpoIID/LytB domain-containing protein [Thermoanaerobaculia bacterium]|jgi:stage II sporulation protein D|nr:SpoIID/LytB domain-containing protein [Thermoanaerobaculia bacterium]
MKRRFVPLLALLFAACTTAPRPPAPLQPSPPPPQSANRLTPVATAARAVSEPRIRVGLLSDQSSVAFPRTADGYTIISDGGPSVIKRGFTVSAPLANAIVRYAVQVSTISDKNSVDAFVEKLRRDTAQRVDTIFDPAAGIYRILAGDFPDQDSATPLKSDLAQRGYSGDMPVVRRPSDQPFEKVHQIVDDEGDSYTMRGDSLLILPVSADTITINQLPYRSAARLFINARGLYNVINELNLDDYLFGVVPAEMGPKIFDELEALKAQAIAARTYAVRNLRNFSSEGYDICPGPACQAYKGFSGEDPLSNQAVTETAGLVLTYDGKPIDALYTSTCGGETSDVGTMFPGRSEPYLKRARCVELDILTIAGRADTALLTEQQASARIFASLARLPEQRTSWSAMDVERAVLEAQRLTGASETDIPKPASSRRGDVLRYLAALLQLDQKARVTTMPEDRRYFFPQSASPEEQAYLAATFLVKFGILPAQDIDRIDLAAAMPREELYALLNSWLREHSAITEATGKILTLDGRNVTLKAEGKTQSFTMPAGIPVFRRLGDRLQEYAQVPVMIGDRAFVYVGWNKTPVAMIVQANLDGASFDRTSSFANWTRSYRAEELVPVINRRNPIQQLIDIRPVTIDPSQRIAELEVTAEGGRKFMLRGLPVRWSLNIPDNLFVYEKTKDPDGMDRYTFFGKGWGHGVGLCQVGSYGMAFRGWTYDRILKHYYTGVEIVPMTALAH